MNTMPESAPKVTEGTSLGRYTILEVLGSGGMGVVYRARDERLERVVAIKVLLPGVLVGDEARRAFRKEALALAKLNHAHIAAVYDVGEQDGVDYLVMELVEGESLAAKIKGGAVPVKEATSILLQVAEALEEAHERGVIHRDLKPANVMVSAKGRVKVLDFGLAKLFAPTGSDATISFAETKGMAGTPLYMSPEQINGQVVDARTDLWSLGVVYYELLTGRTPFEGTNTLAVLRAIVEAPVVAVSKLRPDAPVEAGEIVGRSLQKDPGKRYQTAGEVVGDASQLMMRMSGPVAEVEQGRMSVGRGYVVGAVLVVVTLVVGGGWQYRKMGERRWAREEAIPQMLSLMDVKKELPAFALLEKAEKILPGDAALTKFAEEHTRVVSIASEPAGAEVEVQDYLTPGGEWRKLGVTPLEKVRLPRGYYRWRVSKQGVGEMMVALSTGDGLDFPLDQQQKAPAGMVYSGGGTLESFEGFLGWIGPYELPPYYVDRFEVSNREYQKFVDGGGYTKRELWPGAFAEDGHSVSWEQAIERFRDTSGRAGPADWEGGHYPEGQGDFPVSGVSWYEAMAYAASVGKTLPVVAQRFDMAPEDVEQEVAAESNLSGSGVAKVGAFQGLGPYGTYDTAGNVREWLENTTDHDWRLIMGGSWQSPLYLYATPEASSPFDRSATNGFRCVLNSKRLPAGAVGEVHRKLRDFAAFKPVSDEVFNAYKLLYAYPDTALNAKVEGVVKETVDWTETKVTFDAAYNGERMAAYLFLPKHVKAPYQTVLFFPSARVLELPPDSSTLGDKKFFDYILQSGRAVMYPVYENTYERRVTASHPGGGQDVVLTRDWYKDAARSLDYLATRKDIDSSKVAYLGVSMGAAYGVIFSTLLQDRLKTTILLDGGYFLEKPEPGGDQADFAPRMKKPLLMVNGRYDYAFEVEIAQNPLFKMLGTPDADKKHVLLDTPHDVTEDREHLKAAVLDWLDKYMGRVSE
jgi:formylglycine-generating enzyme required for sulfatase activity/predicted Ser/Thr protein kinase/dienelactone hydrolase